MHKTLWVLAGGALLISSGATAGKLQCWTDEKGTRACGDRVPPQYAKQERKVLNEQGVVVDTKARQKTPEEVAEHERKLAAAAAEKKRFEDQTAYDKYMLQTFDTVTQMQGVRDTRILTLDGRLKGAETAVKETEISLKELRDRAAVAEKAGKPVDAKLAKNITQFEQSLVDSLKSVSQLKKEREDIDLKFKNDVIRYKKLRAGEIQIGSPDAAAIAPPSAP